MSQVILGKKGLSVIPQAPLVGCQRQIGIKPQPTCQHALDVGVQDGHAL